jgi:DNA relaxase NicK
LRIHRFAVSTKARLNRVDIALDDYHGKYFSPRQAFDDCETKAGARVYLPEHRFNKGSKEPKRKMIGSPEDGQTCYIGTQCSSTRLRIYDKALQLKNTNSDSIDSLRHPTWVRWETEFKRKNGVKLDYRMLHPDYWLSFALGASHKLSEIFGQFGLRGVWLMPRGKQDVIEKAARSALSVRKQYGRSIGHLIRYYGLQGFADRFAVADDKGSMAGLTCHDAGAVDVMMWELEHPEVETSSPHQEEFRKLGRRMGIPDSAAKGGLRSSVPGGESVEDYEAIF